MEPFVSDHERLDARSLALHRLVARKLLDNPALIGTARATLRRWHTTEAAPGSAYAEWDGILAGSVQEIARFLTERSERATRLRQSSPFTGILSEGERRAVYESYSARTYHPGGQQHFG